ncbi:MAG: short-chain dehydrogenase [Bacteroidetes bacterium]|jgi:NAD(P)-dependent dehydrogenase (short-subunit alcohol dehydrogenase family)|nr:short-chain dehydrogenase [Bacteroidota bacterium]
MDIKGRTVLVLGGWGLVGTAVCRRLVREGPKKIVITSLLEHEAKEAVEQLSKEYPKKARGFFVPWWGNLFLRHELKDQPREELLKNDATRQKLIDDLLDEFSSKLLERSSVFQLMRSTKPDIVVDCINSATAIAYQDLFQVSRDVRRRLKKGQNDAGLIEATERLLATQYIPQLIRHVQTMYRSMNAAGTTIYVKIGTSGTGGMGLNIPYTHSEERPSSVLLSKSAVAGAHTLLLFLMGRTPDSPITKEIKPTAAIAWKRIGYGEVRKRGKAIRLVDCPPAAGIKLGGTLDLRPEKPVWKETSETLRSVFIDTGENGTFSRSEFEAISTPGQMEYVTPEEIAESVVFEILGGNTGHDIINALDNATLNPTYRAGFLFESAVKELKSLEEKHGTKSIAFEMLGPPRLSKLLYEAHLLQMAFGSMRAVLKTPAKKISSKVTSLIEQGSALRARIVSIGIPILMPDGVTLLRGGEMKIPPFHGESTLPIKPGSVDAWSHDGWVDLRTKNFEGWKKRFQRILEELERIPAGDTSSQFLRTKAYWEDFEAIEPGKIVGWIFSVEEKGERMKA